MLSSPGAQKELVVNGGFNEVKDGKTVAWNEVKAHYAYRDGVGRSGTRALCFENDDPKFYSFPGQPVDLKAGCCYEYEVWVKTEHLTGDGSGASICIEWVDAKGKWLGGAYAEGVKGTKDWTCVKGVTQEIPAAAAKFRVHPYVRKGMLGKAWFDDVRTSFDEVSITSEDGLRLVGHLLESNPGSANWLIYAHGFGGGWKNGLGIARHFAERGYNLLFIDMRAQGDSGGTVIGGGHLERRDLVQWCRWLAERSDEGSGIVLMGSSLGGAAALEAAGEKDLPQQVKAVVSDSAFADFWNEAIHAMGTLGANGKALPAHPLLDVVRLIFRSRKGGYDIAEPSAVAAIAHAQAPVLIIHGADDQLVTPYNAVRLDEAATTSGVDHELLQVPSAGHCCAAMADPELYYSTVFGFVDRH